MDSSVVVQPALRVATVRHIGPYQEIGKAFAQLEVAAQGARLVNAPVSMVGIYHDNPATTPAALLRSDAGILVDATAKLPSALTETFLTGGRHLHTRHLGPYSGLAETWAYLRENAMREYGLTRGLGPSYEVYPNNPGNAAPADLITDIFIPVL